MRVGRKDVGVSGESVSMSVLWNAGYTPLDGCNARYSVKLKCS